jgi:hypothetical protein
LQDIEKAANGFVYFEGNESEKLEYPPRMGI